MLALLKTTFRTKVLAGLVAIVVLFAVAVLLPNTIAGLRSTVQRRSRRRTPAVAP